ncbi:FecCD family ABC transporter permease [Cohnella herbarum]|uniref:Iron ABC transporter permease n=1 Tax=Cohnella herbarum TaxID=2728023 RepID=A0A7Z2VNM5_9BACL|nr:iron ABC transporter permease [Cohnella herbarum]QJD86297.1 iron ABC transporter permease [Cohnella herbarum]
MKRSAKLSLRIAIYMIALLALLASMFLAISYGAKELSMFVVWAAVFQYDETLTTHQVIHELRLPRVIGAAVVGAAFAVAGALMQGVTRNPLADTGILGVNAGATCVVALCFAFVPSMPYLGLIGCSFVGAALSTLFIFALGSKVPGGLTPLRLIIAGSVIAAMLGAISTGIAIYYDLSQDLAFWFSGGVAGIKWLHLKFLVPIIVATLLLTMVLSRTISLLSLGEEVAVNLGGRIKLARILAVTAGVILAGVSVSAAGSISFVGLVIPHISRKLVGVDYRAIIPLSAILGAVLLVLADLAARMVNPPREFALSAMVALIGVPFFLYLARKEKRNL